MTLPGRRHSLRRRELKSLALNREVARRLRRDPDAVLEKARANLEKIRRTHGSARVRGLAEWERLLDGSVEGMIDVLTRDDGRCTELRRCAPFAGVVREPVRQWLLRGFVDEYDAFVAARGRLPQPEELAVMDDVVPRPTAYERAVLELLQVLDTFVRTWIPVVIAGAAVLSFQGAGEPVPAVELMFHDRVFVPDVLLTYRDEAARKRAVFACPVGLSETAIERSTPMELEAGRLAVRLAVPDPDEEPRFGWLDRTDGVNQPVPETAQAGFLQVCRNAAGPREAYRTMCGVRNTMLARGWVPELSALAGAPLRRGGYLVELFALLGRWPEDVRAALLGQLPDPQTLDPTGPVAFFADARNQGHDALARRWGILRGWDLQKTWQILNKGFC